MAEAPKPRKASEESVKLFVGQVPKHMTEAQLLAMFKEFALVDEVNIIKDKATRASRGCCFVICPSRQEADKTVNACHNKRTLPGASSPLQVKYADGELERLGVIYFHCLITYSILNLVLLRCSFTISYSSSNAAFVNDVLVLYYSFSCTSTNNFCHPCYPEHKLFVGMLPKNVSEAEVSSLFSKYGTIKDLQILRGSQQTSKGCAFLKYETKEQALAALEAINGKHKMEGSSVPLVVKWADTEKERQARKAQKAQSQASGLPSVDSAQHPSIFGALPLGYVPPYNGYGYQAPGAYGLMQYRMPPMQNQAAFHNMIPPVNQGNAMRAMAPDLARAVPPRNYAVPSASYIGSAYPALPGLQYPMAYHGGIMSHQPLSGSPGSRPPTGMSSNSPTTSGAGSSSVGQVEGPPGANLFIYHIPQEFGDHELAHAFQQFGRVLSAKVFVDKATGASKCFGFVSYDTPASAQSAISMMNGCQLGGKKLKVQLKRDNNKQNKPY